MYYSIDPLILGWKREPFDLTACLGAEVTISSLDCLKVRYNVNRTKYLFTKRQGATDFLARLIGDIVSVIGIADIIRAYFIVSEHRFDAVLLKTIIENGGVEISKSFSKAILSAAQLEKYKKPVTKEHLKAFISGLMKMNLIPSSVDILAELIACSDFEEIKKIYVNYLIKN